MSLFGLVIQDTADIPVEAAQEEAAPEETKTEEPTPEDTEHTELTPKEAKDDGETDCQTVETSDEEMEADANERDKIHKQLGEP